MKDVEARAYQRMIRELSHSVARSSRRSLDSVSYDMTVPEDDRMLYEKKNQQQTVRDFLFYFVVIIDCFDYSTENHQIGICFCLSYSWMCCVHFYFIFSHFRSIGEVSSPDNLNDSVESLFKRQSIPSTAGTKPQQMLPRSDSYSTLASTSGASNARPTVAVNIDKQQQQFGNSNPTNFSKPLPPNSATNAPSAPSAIVAAAKPNSNSNPSSNQKPLNGGASTEYSNYSTSSNNKQFGNTTVNNNNYTMNNANGYRQSGANNTSSNNNNNSSYYNSNASSSGASKTIVPAVSAGGRATVGAIPAPAVQSRFGNK
eukprot:c13675_g1_i1.p1 GENE.c13675_g1_i1~~c13675_g1_i1.p1  ORF type:complete len:314 (+),score=47.62 c13675_g1_i1:232-1173(+)